MKKKEKFIPIATTRSYVVLFILLAAVQDLSIKFQTITLQKEISWTMFMLFIIISIALLIEWIFNPIQKIIRKGDNNG
jgi:hypothetical protein